MYSHYFKHTIIAHFMHICIYLHQPYHLPHSNLQVLNFSYDPLDLNNRENKRFSATFSIVSTVEIFNSYRQSTLLIPELSLPVIDGYSHRVAQISEQSPADGNTDTAGYVAETDTERSTERETPTNAQADSAVVDETVKNAPVSQSSEYLLSASNSNCNPSSELSTAPNTNGADVLDEIIWSLPPTNVNQSLSKNLQEVLTELPQAGYVQESDAKKPAGYVQEYGEQLLGSSFSKYEDELQTGYGLENDEQFSRQHVEECLKKTKGAYIQEYEQTGYIGEYGEELEVICSQSYGELKEHQYKHNLQPGPIMNCKASILNGYVQNCDKQSETTKVPPNPLSSSTHLSMDGYIPNTDTLSSDQALLEDDAGIPAVMSYLTPPPSPSHITYIPGSETQTYLQSTLLTDSRGYISLDDGPTTIEANLESPSKNDIFSFPLVTRSNSNPFSYSPNLNKTGSGYITSGSSATSGYISGMSTNSYQLASSTCNSGENGWCVPSKSSTSAELDFGSSMQYTAIPEHPESLNTEVCIELDNKSEKFGEPKVNSLAGDDVGTYVTQSSDTEQQTERQYISSKSVTTNDSGPKKQAFRK